MKTSGTVLIVPELSDSGFKIVVNYFDWGADIIFGTENVRFIKRLHSFDQKEFADKLFILLKTNIKPLVITNTTVVMQIENYSQGSLLITLLEDEDPHNLREVMAFVSVEEFEELRSALNEIS